LTVIFMGTPYCEDTTHFRLICILSELYSGHMHTLIATLNHRYRHSLSRFSIMNSYMNFILCLLILKSMISYVVLKPTRNASKQ